MAKHQEQLDAQRRLEKVRLRQEALVRLLKERKAERRRVAQGRTEHVVFHLQDNPSPERLRRFEESFRRNFAAMERPVHATLKVDGEHAAVFKLIPRRTLSRPSRTARPAAPRAVRRVRSNRTRAPSGDDPPGEPEPVAVPEPAR